MFRLSTALLALLIASGTQAETPSSIDVLKAAREACDPGSSGFRLDVGGELSAEAKTAMLKRLFGADFELEGDVAFEAWDGVQQVLREHQLEKSINDNDCIRELVPQLLDFERDRIQGDGNESVPNEDSEISGFRRLGNEICLTVGGARDFPLPVFPGMCISDKAGTSYAVIDRADSRVLTYANAAGRKVSCYPGDRCGFGWRGSPVFSLTVLNGAPTLIYSR